MDKLDAMAVFIRVAELGSFAAAARQRGVARSVVTRQIAQLEGTLGVRLIVRSTRRLSLTPAGAAYLEQCRVILDMIEAAETGLAEEDQAPRGSLRISLPLSFGLKRLAPVLLSFAQDHPLVRLEMDYSDRRVNLIEEGVDLSIRITRQLAGTDIVRKLGTARARAVASPGYLASRGHPRHPADLADHECLGYMRGGSPDTWSFVIDGSVVDFPIQARVHANNGDVLAEAAARGMGITCEPDFIVDELIGQGRLVTVLDAYPIPDFGIYAVLPSNRQVPYRVRALLDFLAARLGESPAHG